MHQYNVLISSMAIQMEKKGGGNPTGGSREISLNRILIEIN